MSASISRKVAFVATFPPRQCGIGTFTNDLISNISLNAGNDFSPLVVAMQNDEPCRYIDPVKFEIRQKVKNDYVCAADYINFSHVDLISVQHEFGLFGGEAGSYLNLLLRRVNAPVITTLHTVLEDPEEHYFQSMVDVCGASEKIIVMNKRGIEMLKDIYKVDESKIMLIPHGIPDLPFVDSSYYKHKFGMEDRKTILTFGLLSRNKGIEFMLEAMPEIIKADPSVLYIILGATHPSVLKHDGEEYRFSLQHKIKDLGIEDHVIFHNRFVNDLELHNFLCAADLYVTPYLNKAQLTSGTLAFAVGTGKAVVSTPYWAAEELLSDGRGKLIEFSKPESLSKAVVEILQNDSLFYKLRRKAYDYGRTMTWPLIGQKYWELFKNFELSVKMPSRSLTEKKTTVSLLEVPEPPLDHLKRLTDDTGLYQHAKFILPNRYHGYCTDDNARAVVAMVKYYKQYTEPQALEMFEKYLSFIYHAQMEDGTVTNFMSFDRKWYDEQPAHDALARTLWAFGAVLAQPPMPSYISIIKDCFDRSVKLIPSLSPRGKAYAIFGLSDYLEQFPGASDIKRHLELAAEDLYKLYEKNSEPEWQWFENILTYDNAILPGALYQSAAVLENEKYLEAANKTCLFLLQKTFVNNDHFSFIGCNGWYPRNGQPAKFDQQPIEVASTVMMLQAAYQTCGNIKLLKLQKKAFDWFMGDNDLHIPVYDFRTKGCGDGLESAGVNLNQGAESMVSFLLSLLCVIESYSAKNRHNGSDLLLDKKLADNNQKQNNNDNLEAKKTENNKKKQKTDKTEAIIENLF
jgi:glycosyltransferase involved in cell wall biosynthesis